MKRLMKESFAAVIAASFLGVALPACGGDEVSTAQPPPPRSSKKKPAPRGGGKPGAGDRIGYAKIDDEYRRDLSERDFVPDPNGDVRRDPFRSWVLRPNLEVSGDGEVVKTDICTESNVRWGAQGYSVRDLRLVGLVKRGRSYAQFIDKSDKDSWIVRRGDCLGQEKAIIEEIGVGYVSLSITPEAPPGAPAPAARRQDIPLYPDELDIPDGVMPELED